MNNAPAHSTLHSGIRRLSFALAWAYALVVLAWFFARLAWGDQYWLLALWNSFPVWLFLPAPLAAALAAISRRRAAWGAVIVPVILWLALFGWRFLPRLPRAEGSDGALRVMAFNLLALNRNVEGIVAAIEATQPDLIAFAELTPAVDGALAERLGAVYPYRTLHRMEGASFGSGIYSRWPVVDLGSLSTGLGLRSAAADVNTPDGVVRFVALHPRATLLYTDSFARAKESIEGSFRAREAQTAAVCRYLDRWGDRPVILAGDLNATEFSDAYRCVAQRLDDAYRKTGYGLGHTWPNPEYSVNGHLSLLARIDYVFYSRHWVATDARVLDMATGSDHRPVVVMLRRSP